MDFVKPDYYFDIFKNSKWSNNIYCCYSSSGSGGCGKVWHDKFYMFEGKYLLAIAFFCCEYNSKGDQRNDCFEY